LAGLPAESLFHDVRYAIRSMWRAPLFAASVASTIGLGLGILCSAFTILNSYLLKPVDLPDPYALYEPGWDTATVARHKFSLADFDEMRRASVGNAPYFSGLVAGQEVSVMQDDVRVTGLLVTGNYFQVLGGQAAMGRMLTPDDVRAPGSAPVVVLSDVAWRIRYGADASIVGKSVALGRQRFEVVGVAPRGFGLAGQEMAAFWAPLTMSRAFSVADPWTDTTAPLLFVVGRLHKGMTASQARGWFDVWLRQRFPAGSDAAPMSVRFESRATRLPMQGGPALTLTLLIESAFALVLLVACANVTNMLLARAFGREREIAVRLSLGASRWRIARQLTIESLVLAVPAAAFGLGLTLLTARIFPMLIVGTFPPGLGPVEMIMVPLDPDVRVMSFLFAAAVASAVLVTLAPAVRVTRANLVRASKGESAMDVRRSRLRTGLVAMQIGACVLFLIGATGLIKESTRLADPDARISYERVTSVRVSPAIRADVAARLRSDPAVDYVAAAWRPPLVGPLRPIGVVASGTRIEQNANFMVVSSEYFPLFDIRIVQGRAFTAQEAEDSAPVVLVSAATARTLWPGRDPIGQTLDLVPPSVRRPGRLPNHASVRVIGVTEDVVSGLILDGVDKTCVYFATGIRSSGDTSLLVRGRTDGAAVRGAAAAAIKAIDPDATFETFSIREVMGLMKWTIQAFSVTASVLGVVGLLLAFSGTYAVVAFLVTQRTREFGVRMALGASVAHIISGMMTETLRTASIGLAAGVAVSIALVRLFRGAIVIIPELSLGPYLLGVGIVLTATLVAALLPSLRTTRIDPSKALRVE
jgi:predicted permease